MPDSTITLRTRADLAALIETGKSFNVLSKEEQQAEKDALRLAQSMARVDAALKQPAEGAARLRAALAGATYIDPTQGVAALNQLVSLEQKAEAEAARLAKANAGLGTAGGLPILPRTAESFGPQAIAQLSGVTLGPQLLQQFAQFGETAAKDALQLRETKNSLFAVAGDTKTYTTILAEARNQQVLFGGSVQENIDGLQGLVVIARATGAQLNTLIDFQKRLTVLDPRQGAVGARVALAEALSGNITSLNRRFQIPKEELEKLKDATIPVSERLNALDSFLNKVGVTSESITSKVDQDAASFRRLGQELDTARLKGGDALASAFGGAAEGMARLVGVINGNPEAIAKLGSLLGGVPVITGPGGTEERIKSLQAQADAQSQLRNGIGGGVAASKLGNQQSEAEQLLTLLNFVGDRSAAAVQQATQAFIQPGQSTDQYIAKLRQLVQDTQNHVLTQQEATDKVAADTKAKIDAGIETQKLADFQRQLNADSLLAAKGLLGSGDQSLLLANKYHYTADEAQYLIDKQAFLAGQGSKKVTPPDDSRSSADAQKRADAVHQSEVNLALTRAKTSTQKIAILQKELSGTTDVIKRNELLGRIESEKSSAAKGYTSELGRQLTTQESIYDALNKQRDAQISIQKLTAENTIKTLDEDKKLRSARAVLVKPEASAEQKARAQASIDIISADRAQREQELRKQSTTAGGTITDKGKLLQSVPGGGQPSQLAGGPIAPQAPGTQPAAVSGGQGTPLILTMDGREVGKIVLPFLVDELLTGVRQVRASKGA